MALFGLSALAVLNPATDRFVSLSLGNTLMLKACGFIEDHQARILDVSESSLRVRVGQHWYERILMGRSDQKPLEIALEFGELDEQSDLKTSVQGRSPNNYCTIDVAIRPASLRWSQQEFNEEARRMIWVLRSYFMACC